MFHNCLRARHIACFTIVHLICAKVQIVDNLSRISILKMILTFMRCHLSSGILDSKINVHDSYKYSILVCAQIQGEVTLQVGCFETNTFSSLSCVQQSHCKENGVPGVKHHTSNIHHLLQVVEIKLVFTCGISKLISSC